MPFYYKKVLVISDNIGQCLLLRDIFIEKGITGEVETGWACSPYSNSGMFSEKSGLAFSSVDLKNPAEVKKIINGWPLVISMHCKQLFPAELVKAVKCINVHPGYNPVNRGWYPQVFAIINNSIIGATIHEIDEQLDHGAIIDRMEVPKYETDTSLDLYNRVLAAEAELLRKNIIPVLKNVYTSFAPEAEGKLYLKKDFKGLCQLDLKEQNTLQFFITKLRALTHGNFNNAYYYDADGKKIFVKIKLEAE
ncbi:MAG: dTDP-4-amino-4,6-dideoxyglucose formyltransferase [Chitinophagaceae bacterium]|nr:dTDP-4-amino-4,6-dideoxyglucose formyltransferase [Chitinophagaceae bacterium]